MSYDAHPHSWRSLAVRPSVVRRAVKMACIVGTVLISINHGDAILRGEVDGGRLTKMLLTVMVPFAVSTISSVGALMEKERANTR